MLESIPETKRQDSAQSKKSDCTQSTATGPPSRQVSPESTKSIGKKKQKPPIWCADTSLDLHWNDGDRPVPRWLRCFMCFEIEQPAQATQASQNKPKPIFHAQKDIESTQAESLMFS
mmetsp:Transcript_35753/g.56976  ORF Transcript_35753/g.56976 Transcript_35753/m.56976 type:complete len:117 (+) Transcript_35753:41-391(+)